MVSSLSVNELNTEYEDKMPLERTELLIKEGQEEAFATAMRTQGVPLLSGVPGVLSVSFGRGVENPVKFLLLVDWQTMEAHATYNKTPASGAIRALIRPFSQGGSMEHFTME
jgi:heme-degrading monooxygenase HmoA